MSTASIASTVEWKPSVGLGQQFQYERETPPRAPKREELGVGSQVTLRFPPDDHRGRLAWFPRLRPWLVDGAVGEVVEYDEKHDLALVRFADAPSEEPQPLTVWCSRCGRTIAVEVPLRDGVMCPECRKVYVPTPASLYGGATDWVSGEYLETPLVEPERPQRTKAPSHNRLDDVFARLAAKFAGGAL